MRKIKQQIILLLLFLIPLISNGQEADTTRILFVGNSFTYFWNMPHLVQAMAKEAKKPIRTYQSTVGGSNLEQHWKEEKGTITRRLLEEKEYDYVVFNNHSASPIETPESFMEYGGKFAELIKSKGATPVFFMTWSYESNPLMQEKITEMYSLLAEQTDSELVPVGQVWDKVREERPTLDLYHDDKHSSPIGTYLIALVFYHHFTGNDTKGLPERLISKDQYGEKLYLAILTKSDAKYLQQSVDEFFIKRSKGE